MTTIRCSQVVTADVAAEPVGGPVGRDQRVLHGVGGLFAIAEGAQGDRPQPVPVPADQLGEGVRVTADVRAQQRVVVARRSCGPARAVDGRTGVSRPSPGPGQAPRP